MLDLVRPELLPNTEIRRRSDGNEGLYHAESGHSFVTSPDQSNLVQLFDGKRSLLEISAEYMNRYGFVPFAALDDLMRGLADADLLVNPPENPQGPGGTDRDSWAQLVAPTSRWRFRLPWPTALRALELLAFPALAVWVVQHQPRAALSPYDVPVFYAGAALALTLRARLNAAVCALFGFPPRRAHLISSAGVVHLAPDHGVGVLMDKGPRMLAHLGALAGVGCAIAIGYPWPGVFAGAAVVLLLDLCPLVRSSASGLLSALSGQVHLRDHIRGYVGLPLLKSLLTFNVRRAGAGLFLSGVLSTVWIGVFLYVVLGVGIPVGLQLMNLGIKASGPAAILAYFGAFVLLAIFPLPLLLMVVIRGIESAFTVLWPPDAGGKRAGGAVDLSVFRSIPLFSKLLDADLALIAAQSRQMTYDSGQVIVEEGASGNTFYSVRQGSVEVTRGGSADQPKVLARLGAGDCFGETAMLKDGKRTATVRALSQTEVIELASEAFERVVANVGGVDFASVLRAASTIGKSKLFRELPAERLSSLATQFEPRSVAAGTDVVRFGDAGAEFFLIARGQVEVLSAQGAKLTQLGDGDHFGEIALLRKVPRTATVRTTADTLLLVLSREVFLRALHADLSLSARVEQSVEARLTRDA